MSEQQVRLEKDALGHRGGISACSCRGEKNPRGLAGCTLAARLRAGGGLGASPVRYAEQPGRGGTGSGVWRWQGGSQSPAPPQVGQEEGPRRQGIHSPHLHSRATPDSFSRAGLYLNAAGKWGSGSSGGSLGGRTD